jgi:hypothetical protein
MGIRRYTASADNTIVNAYESNLTTRGTGSNMGLSDVLETFSIYGRETTSSQELSRILIQFPIDDVVNDRTAGNLPVSGNVSFYLRMFNAAHSRTTPRDATLVVMNVSQSWQEGVGLDMRNYEDVTLGNEGSNWMSASNSAFWTDVNGTLLAGGSYHTQSAPNADHNQEVFIYKQTFPEGIEDLLIEITPTVEQWIAGTYDNYGLGVFLTASQEAFNSGSDNLVVSRVPGQLALDGNDDTTQSVIYNPSGSTTSFYTKRFFGRGSQYWYKRPVIEARWDSITRDNRGNFFYSSSFASADDNLNTIYFYNYVRGQLADLPNLGPSAGYEKKIYVSIYSGSVGGYYSDQGGGDGDDVAPSDVPVSGTTSANTGAVQILSPDASTGGSVNAGYLTVVTGGIVSTGVYSASFAFTGSKNPAVLKTIYDVWWTGSAAAANANTAPYQFYTGSIKPERVMGSGHSHKPSYYLNITNLRDQYHPGELVRFNLYVRDKYWSPNIYTVANSEVETTMIQSASYRVYRVLDAFEAIPYGTGSELHTGLSYDVSGNYFDFDMNLLEPGYAYAFKFAFYDSAVSSWIEQDQTFKFRVEDYEY